MPLDRILVHPDVFALRPDFAVLAITAAGLLNGPTDEESRRWLRAAEAAARGAGASAPLDPHLIAWQDAYRAFGAKPQRTCSSGEALWRRAVGESGLPEISRLVDAYNAVSVEHRLPVGGEDLAHFVGPIRLIRAAGTERFETVKSGEVIVESPAPGEVAWADDLGVTCRRWNWRQGTRTRLTDATTDALFLLERLEPMSLDALQAAGDALVVRLRACGPGVAIVMRWFGPGA